MDFIDIHTHQNSNKNSVTTVVNCYPNSTDFSNLFSIGIHPWYIEEKNIATEIHFVEQQLQLKNCFAIGECGLDKLSETNYNLQLSVFKKHIFLSERYQKPLIIHCVKSFQEILHLKKIIKPQQPWIIHGFNKNSQVAASLLKNGCYLSFGKALITSTKLQEVFLNISLNTIFLETDDDATITIKEVYKKAATTKGIEIEKLQENIHRNFNKLYTK